MSAQQTSFNRNAHFTKTTPPDPNWKPGQGVNGHPEAYRFDPSASFKVIEIGKTEIEPRTVYQLMLGGISPRPVALVGTYNAEGNPNLAPISWYQMVSHDPPMAMVSFGGTTRRKDSEANIKLHKNFTISSSSEPYGEALNFASIEAPSTTSEFALSGLTPVPGRVVHAPRVGEAPFAMELELDFFRDWTNDKGVHTTSMVVGRVKMIHIREDVMNEDNMIDISKTLPISRFAGTTYGRSVLGYDINRPVWDQSRNDDLVQEFAKKGAEVAYDKVNRDPVLAKFP